MKIVACAGCSTEFPYDPSRPNKKRCKPNCGRQRSNESSHGARAKHHADNDIEFIGVDGEGQSCIEYSEEWDEESGEMVRVRRPGHAYVLFSAGDQSLHKNGEPLNYHEIFTFLWEQFLAHPKATFVGFYLGYDFTQWFRSLPENRAYKLLHKQGIESRKPDNAEFHWLFPVYVGQWQIDILGFKRFKLRPHVKREDWPECQVAHKTPDQIADCALGLHKKHPHPWLYVCDVGSFFQTSFLNAIDPKGWSTPIVSDEEYEIIRQGKEHRDSAILDADMIKYNVLENEVLGRLMAKLNEGFVHDNIILKRNQWFGPGQAAQKWLANVGCPTGETIREEVPQWARDAARKSYYGGWFEIFVHGVVDATSYSYDINSAYPYAISSLPCLLHGVWSKGDGTPLRLGKRSYRLVNADVTGSDKYIGCMPHRTAQGNILRPHKTGGWYWWHEIQAAKRAKLISRVTIHEWIDYEPCKCPPPLASIADLYEGRLRVGKNTPEGKAKKLVFNSAYGKLAQSIGQPRFSNPIWASLITTHCRVMILNAIASHPEKSKHTLMVATDSVTFLTPHPKLDFHESRLGAWDASEYENLSLFMPGVYWHDKTRASVRAGGSVGVKSRGVSGRDLARVIDQVDRQWGRRNRPSNGHDVGWAKATIPLTFPMVTAKSAITRGDWQSCGRVEFGAVREIDSNPTAKRALALYDTETDPDRVLLHSFPYHKAPEERSTPYEPRFGDDDDQDPDLDYVSPDGPIQQVLIQTLIPR